MQQGTSMGPASPRHAGSMAPGGALAPGEPSSPARPRPCENRGEAPAGTARSPPMQSAKEGAAGERGMLVRILLRAGTSRGVSPYTSQEADKERALRGTPSSSLQAGHPARSTSQDPPRLASAAPQPCRWEQSARAGPGTSSTAVLGMAENTFASEEGTRMAGQGLQTSTPRPASAPAGGKMRGSPSTPRLPPGWRRASQREVGSSPGANNAPSLCRSSAGTLPAAGRGRGSCALPRGSAGKLGPENAARERSRVRTLRQAFLALQAALPSVPPDTKLSKLDVLVLATSYITHLSHTLRQGQPPPEAAPPARAPSFLHPMKKWPMRSRLYAGAWGADAADVPAAAPAAPSSRMRRGCEGGSPGAGRAAP